MSYIINIFKYAGSWARNLETYTLFLLLPLDKVTEPFHASVSFYF